MRYSKVMRVVAVVLSIFIALNSSASVAVQSVYAEVVECWSCHFLKNLSCIFCGSGHVAR